MKKFYITTPIYYVNARPHLGHAYTTIAADVLARYYRVQGWKVFFLTGTDEHGGKIEKAAQKVGKSPQQFCDENSERFKKVWEELNISYDNFIRTTDPSHIKAVKKALEILYKRNFIYKGIYKGLYCPGCEQYKTESDLKDGKCPDHQIKPELIEEESYLFRLSRFENILKEKIRTDELKIEPEQRKNEVLKFLSQGLKDISISRQRVRWGIRLPFDQRLTAYVWVDAFLNYLTGIGWEGDPKNIPEFWPPDVQLMSKDIIRVHATIWPGLLLALEIPLPKRLFVHGYFTIEGQKMSKSLGNVIWPEEMIGKFGVDGTRYLLLSSCPFGQDGDISWQKLIKKYNADLPKGLGNLVSRILALAEKINTNSYLREKNLSLQQIQNVNLRKEVENTWQNYKRSFQKLKLNESLVWIWNLISFCDRLIQKERPWEELNKHQSIICDLLRVLKNIAEMLQVFLPESSERILDQIKRRKREKPLFPKL